ncbi:MAG: HpaII family restriction endonuclease [Candidatus Paceibacterota bacterium]
MITKGNKGEWSEFYAFVKLIADRKLNGATENLEKIEDIFYPVLKIIRNEATGVHGYEMLDDGKVRILKSGEEIAIVDSSDLKSKVVSIFNQIKAGNEASFEVPIAQEIMERFNVQRLNAGNTRKEDIVLKIHDRSTGMDPEVGFSIKSMLGSAATLLNASSATNFTFQISGLSDKDITEINKISSKSKVRDRLREIINRGGKISFAKIDSLVFEKNLRKVDTVLPEIVAELLLAYYGDLGPTLNQLVGHLGENNAKILSFDMDQSDYEFKLKALLHNIALGMVPNTAWDGLLRAHGGYIIVREDGEIVCYHVYNADAFRTYLFKNTKLETPSTSRHGFGKIVKEENGHILKLNFQLRFVR